MRRQTAFALCGAGATTLYLGVWSYSPSWESPKRSYFWSMPWKSRLLYLMYERFPWIVERQLPLLSFKSSIQSLYNCEAFLWRAYESVRDAPDGAVSPMATSSLIFTVSRLFSLSEAPLKALKKQKGHQVNNVDDPFDTSSQNDDLLPLISLQELALERLLKKPHVGESIAEETKRLESFVIFGPQLMANLKIFNLHEKELIWRAKFIALRERLPLYLPFNFRQSLIATLTDITSAS